jgi:hypothetical protein
VAPVRHRGRLGHQGIRKQNPRRVRVPPAWRERRHRLRAAEFITNQLLLISEFRAQSFRTLRYGYQLGKFHVTRNDERSLAFQIEVRNATKGHGTPTGFDGERQVFLHVIVRDRDNRIVFQSGDRDPNGDVRNLHSSYVRDGKVPLDKQLFSVQSEFLELSAHGGERERILPIPVSQGALPFNRPNESSSLLISHPTATRKQASVIPPLGSFQANYKVPAKALTGKRPYSVEFTFIAQMVPVNLVNEISSVGLPALVAPLSARPRRERKRPHPHQRPNHGPWLGLPGPPLAPLSPILDSRTPRKNHHR